MERPESGVAAVPGKSAPQRRGRGRPPKQGGGKAAAATAAAAKKPKAASAATRGSASSQRERTTVSAATAAARHAGEYQPASFLLRPPKPAAAAAAITAITTATSRDDNDDDGCCCYYGIPVPDAPPQNCCAACRATRNAELADDAVLLCDGPDCGREFHWQCCVPALSAIPGPSEPWYCRDCARQGAAAALELHLGQADASRADCATARAYRESLWERDWQELQAPGCDDAIAKRPRSELDWAVPAHGVALPPLRKRSRSSPASNKRNRAPVPGHETGGQEQNHVAVPDALRPGQSWADFLTAAAAANSTSTPDFLLGRPVRIYVPTANVYHTGRIVDYRPCTAWPSTATTPTTPTPTTPTPTMEYLVRFVAGMDDRKTPYQHWIVLEEHALAIGTSLVWGKFTRNTFRPAMLWVRTARELVPVQHMLREAAFEIVFDDAPFISSPEAKSWIAQWQRKAAVAMARTFGSDETYKLLSLEYECVDFFDANAVRQYGTTQETKMLMAVAQAEWHEQERVRAWHKIQAGNPNARRALTSNNEYALGDLLVPAPTATGGGGGIHSNRRDHRMAHADPCALVPAGLDRLKIARLLEQQGCKVTKDLLSSMSVKIVPMDMSRYNRGRQQELEPDHVQDDCKLPDG